jgi:hypothetical protein
MSKAPIARPNSTPAASGPSASKAHGSGSAPSAPKANSGAMPNHSLVTESLGTVNPPTMNYGQGAKAPAQSNNDVSKTHGS